MALSSTGTSEQFLLVWGGMNLQQIPLISAFVEANTPLGIANEFKFRGLQLEIFHVKSLVYAARVKKELVGWDGKQGPGQFTNTWLVEVLQVL